MLNSITRRDGETISFGNLDEWFEEFSNNPVTATLSLGNGFWFFFDPHHGSTFNVTLHITRDVNDLIDKITEMAKTLEVDCGEPSAAAAYVEIGSVAGAEKFQGLTEWEIKELARVFPSSVAATDLLRRSALPTGRLPAFGAGDTPEWFWTAVGIQLDFGIAPDGRQVLLAAAQRLYPANSVFSRALGL
ncbi:effector-associated domain EAD1-containing protein [Pseudofrankia sp. BMG5.37]|uniref:effector-associated domain EAD1-containing protein n=1 Tax=Pseudofrankia sp. BMG5.37 TaxID=3050035 RepID=UPI0028939FFA|nr:effector-associated domain EAD1-containing protein [Pseudofrankia sp. BMG5.37]MDT3445823.1 effector-associated domain EAD1-containing protein [Pseudofrankia sp. BMG5.37]